MSKDTRIAIKRLGDNHPRLYGLDSVLNSIDQGRIECGRYADAVKRVKVDATKRKVGYDDGDPGK